MTGNLSKKSAAKLVQEAALGTSVLQGALSEEYSFVGVKTVEVITAVTQEMTDYNREGTNRYGTPAEIQDTAQELTLTQDKSFSVTVDKGNYQDQNFLKKAGAILKAQIRERAIPLYDKYCLGVLAAKAGAANEDTSALTKANIASRVMDGTVVLDDAEMPEENRTLFVSAKAYKLLKLSDEFISVQELGAKSIGKGHVGEFDGMAVRKVPARRMPEGVNFIIVHKDSATAPRKLHDAKIHKDPPGISGSLIEGRWYYDCFVLDARNKGVYVDKAA
ncbi:MAG: hypothetical protein IJO54_06930 [Oscillospiraceae bacterium]|nr:hypothetical protein [Oscillospiraceae bacterium]